MERGCRLGPLSPSPARPTLEQLPLELLDLCLHRVLVPHEPVQAVRLEPRARHDHRVRLAERVIAAAAAGRQHRRRVEMTAA